MIKGGLGVFLSQCVLPLSGQGGAPTTSRGRFARMAPKIGPVMVFAANEPRESVGKRRG